ncbi:MAG TPA: site-2 protease family protein [Candidatus Binataceae bacterium]|nr:site-2 protease family protein [Candidatus Binataceae bacterium]
MAGGSSRAIRLVKIAGIQVDIDYSWLIIFGLVLWSLASGYFPQAYPGHTRAQYWIVGLVATLFFFSSVLFHELCHAFMGNRLGENIDRITLFIFGGMAHLTGEPKNADDEFKIAVVGPLSSLALGLVFWLVAGALSGAGAVTLWAAVFRYLAYLNVALAVFNLLPGYPLDGGRLLRAVLWKRWGSIERATARAADWGNTIAWGLMLMGVLEIFGGALIGGLWLIFIGLFLRGAAAGGYQGTMVEQMLQRVRVGDIMTPDPITLDSGISVSDAVENYFLRLGHGGFPVATEGRVVGMLTLSMVSKCPVEERAGKKAGDLMRPLDASIEISPSATALAAMHQMNDSTSRRLVVLDNGKFVGLVTLTGITRFVQIKSQLGTAATKVSPAAGQDSVQEH